VTLLCLAADAGAESRVARSGALPEWSVDLHVHLSMKPALGWLFRGELEEPLVADSWDDRLSSKANEQTLLRSGVGVMVVALYAHPLFAGDMRKSIRAQMAEVERLVKRQPQWAIARRADEAEALLRGGKRVIVFSLEGAAGVLESQADLEEFIDARGIAIVTPLHLVDDRFGGAALLGGMGRVANPLAMVDGRRARRMDTHFEDGIARSRRGLTLMGQRLVIELVRRGVWIDLTHASDAALDKMLPILQAADQPLLISHTSPRHFRHAERAVSESLLEAVAQSGGVLGLLPSEDGMPDAKGATHDCPDSCRPEQCSGSVLGLAEVYSHIARVLPPVAIALGSDFNGGIRHLRAACGTGTSLDEPAGFYHLGQTPQLWQALRRAGAPVPALRHTLGYFLDTWRRVRPARLAGLDAKLPRLPRHEHMAGPSLELYAHVGVAHVGRAHGDVASVPGLSLGFGGRVLKDSGSALAVEPMAYFAGAHVDAVTIPSRHTMPWLSASFAPVGIAADDGAVYLDGQLASTRLLRDVALSRRWDLRAALLRGRARAIPGLLYRPGRQQLFVEIGFGALGYRGLWDVNGTPPAHGFHLADIDARTGISFPAQHDVRLYLQASAGVALFGGDAGVRYASERAVGFGAAIGLGASGATLRLDSRWLAWRTPAHSGDLKRDELRATITIPLSRSIHVP
jgi:membrane dipeptidase